MTKKTFVLMLSFIMIASQAQAFWVWTPETRRWVNPKYSVKETPQKQLEYALEIAKSGEYKEAESEMQKLIKHYPKAREAADAQFYIGEFQEKQGEYYKAFKSYQEVIIKYPFAERTAEVVKRQYDIGSLLLDGKGKEEEGFLAKMSSARNKVEEIFNQVIKNAPYGEYAAQAQYKIGLFLKGEELLQEARDAFEKTVNDYPESEWAKAARYQIALADAQRSAAAGYDQKITESAITGFKNFLKDYPDAELSAEAQGHISELRLKEAENNFIIAQFYEKQGAYPAAKLYYSNIVEEYKDTVWAQKALEKIQNLGKK